MKKTKVLIIGSGPAGYTAGIYAGRAMLNPVLVSGMEQGGQLTITTDVDNYPGFAETVQGPWLMNQMEAQCSRAGCEIIFDQISKISLDKRPFKAFGELGNEFEADTVIICTGAKAKWLGLPSEQNFLGHGVSACATCDGTFFKDKKVCVIGGGNTASEEALYLSGLCEKVTLIHRRNELRAERILQEKVFNSPNIDVVWDHVVEEIIGEESPKKVKGVVLTHVQTQKKQTLETDGVFIAIGHKPSTELFKEQLETDGEGYIQCPPGGTSTSIPGVFAAGDVRDNHYRQAVTAAGLGCMAALDAEKFLNA